MATEKQIFLSLDVDRILLKHFNILTFSVNSVTSDSFFSNL